MLLNYHEPLFRPPSEANSLIFQVTLGCSFNRCSFCVMYKTKTYSEKPLEQVLSEIDRMAFLGPQIEKVFLADGDALNLPTSHLLAILAHLHERFPRLRQVSCYALPGNLKKKSLSELRDLRAAGLSLIYYGIETGSPKLLKRIVKGATPEIMIAGLNKASDAGLRISATVILGLGGKHLWKEHMTGTIALINQVRLDYLSTLQLFLHDSVRDAFIQHFEKQGDVFVPQDDPGILTEQYHLISGINPAQSLEFRSNHASNALPLKGRLPDDKAHLLKLVEAGQSGHIPLRPKAYRAM